MEAATVRFGAGGDEQMLAEHAVTLRRDTGTPSQLPPCARQVTLRDPVWACREPNPMGHSRNYLQMLIVKCAHRVNPSRALVIWTSVMSGKKPQELYCRINASNRIGFIKCSDGIWCDDSSPRAL